MNFSKYLALTILTLGVTMVQSCGRSAIEQVQAEADQNRKQISRLESQLVQARTALAEQNEEKTRLVEQLHSFRDRVKELEKMTAKPTESKPEPSRDRGSDSGRVELLGAKAVAEFKVDQLTKKIDKLTADLTEKQQEAAQAARSQQEKEEEIGRLRQALADSSTTKNLEAASLKTKLESVQSELKDRSAALESVKRDLSEKTELLATLKNAVTDAGRLKAGAESESARLKSELADALKKSDAFQTQAENIRNDFQTCQSQFTQVRNEMEKYRRDLETRTAEANIQNQEILRLRAEIAALSQSSRTVDSGPQESETPKLDHILRPPSVGEAGKGSVSNYY